MKSDIEIKDDVYNVIKGSALEMAITGKLSKTGRPFGSNLEDVVVSILDNGTGQIQEAFVNVNIYVPNLKNDQTNGMEIDDIRCRELCKLASELLEVQRGDDYRFTLDKQRVMEVNGKNEHFINNRLLFRQVNE